MAVKKASTANKLVATKKAVTKKAAVKGVTKKASASSAITEKQNKTQVIAAIAEETGLSRKDVSAVFASLADLAGRHLKKRGSGEFTVPELGVKIRRMTKPATKARKGVNPFTGEPAVFKAKPARNVVKITALKALKEVVTK